jgi:hypothetical protein
MLISITYFKEILIKEDENNTLSGSFYKKYFKKIGLFYKKYFLNLFFMKCTILFVPLLNKIK